MALCSSEGLNCKLRQAVCPKKADLLIGLLRITVDDQFWLWSTAIDHRSDSTTSKWWRLFVSIGTAAISLNKKVSPEPNGVADSSLFAAHRSARSSGLQRLRFWSWSEKNRFGLMNRFFFDFFGITYLDTAIFWNGKCCRCRERTSGSIWWEATSSSKKCFGRLCSVLKNRAFQVLCIQDWMNSDLGRFATWMFPGCSLSWAWELIPLVQRLSLMMGGLTTTTPTTRPARLISVVTRKLRKSGGISILLTASSWRWRGDEAMPVNSSLRNFLVLWIVFLGVMLLKIYSPTLQAIVKSQLIF